MITITITITAEKKNKLESKTTILQYKEVKNEANTVIEYFVIVLFVTAAWAEFDLLESQVANFFETIVVVVSIRFVVFTKSFFGN